jgi:hypothetical protein
MGAREESPCGQISRSPKRLICRKRLAAEGRACRETRTSRLLKGQSARTTIEQAPIRLRKAEPIKKQRLEKKDRLAALFWER